MGEHKFRDVRQYPLIGGMLTVQRLVIVVAVGFALVGCGSPESAWQEAKVAGTADDYRRFLLTAVAEEHYYPNY